MNKTFALLTVCVFFIGMVVAAQTTPKMQSADSKATIQGTVMKAGAGQPLKRARVSLRRADTQQRPVGGAAAAGNVVQALQQALQQMAGATQAVTDDNGQFLFTNVDPGQYRISADHDGYVRQEFGQRSFSGPGILLSVAAGQRLTNIDFQMVPTGSITGRIVNEDGEPVAGVQVQAQYYTYAQGRRTLTPAGQSDQTNDLGEYRIYWLPPGEYYVSAVPRRGAIVAANPVVNQTSAASRGGLGRGGRGQSLPNSAAGNDGPGNETYPPTYFPGTINPDGASPIPVQPAAEIRGVDFNLRPTATVSIRGRVLVPFSEAQSATPQLNGNRGAGPRGGGRGGPPINLMLTRIGTGRGGGFNGGPNRAMVQPDGTFQINGVVPGSYSLVAVARQDAQQYSARLKIDVGDADVENVSLPLRPGIAIPGRISYEGAPPQNFKMSQLRVSFVPTEDSPGFGGTAGAAVADDGSFTLQNVSPMEYRVRVSGFPQGGYVTAGSIGGVDAVNQPFFIAGDQQVQMQLQIGFAAGRVQGTVVDSQGNVFAGALATLIPDSPRRERTDLYFSAPTDQSGRFSFPSVPPGTYRLFTWEDIPNGAYQDPDFIQRYEDRGRPVRVDAGSSVDVDATVISRS